MEACSIGVRTNRQLLAPIALFLSDLCAWTAASIIYAPSADIRSMQGITGHIDVNFEFKSKMNELGGLVRVSNIGKNLFSGIRAFSTLNMAQVRCLYLPFPTNIPDELSNPEPDWDTDHEVEECYNQGNVYWPGFAAGPERYAANAFKLCPAVWVWVLFMRIRRSDWNRVSDKIQRMFL